MSTVEPKKIEHRRPSVSSTRVEEVQVVDHRRAAVLRPLTSDPMAEAALRITPYAWEKMHYCMRRMGRCEIGFMGVSDPDDLLLVRDVLIMKQEVSSASTTFDRTWMANLLCELVDPESANPLKVDQFMRIWIHTHPRMSTKPSQRDVDAFLNKSDFGGAPWGVMLILSDQDQPFCAHRSTDVNGQNLVNRLELELCTSVDFPGVSQADRRDWDEQLVARVEEVAYIKQTVGKGVPGTSKSVPAKAPPKSPAPFVDTSYDPAGQVFGWEDYYTDSDEMFDPRYGTPQYAARHQSSTPPTTPSNDGQTLLDLDRDETEYMATRGSLFHTMDSDAAITLFMYATDALKHGDKNCDEELLEELEQLGVIHSGIDPKTNDILFSYRPSDKVPERILNTSQLIALDREEPENEEAKKELISAELWLIEAYGVLDRDMLCSRPCETDGWGDHIAVITHWVCVDGEVIYVTPEERNSLIEIAAGKRTLDTVLFGLICGREGEDPIGFNLGNEETDVITRPLQERKIADAWQECAVICNQGRQEGMAVAVIEELLAICRKTQAVPEGYALEFDHVLAHLRDAGYEPDGVDTIKMLEGTQVDPSPHDVSQIIILEEDEEE